MSSYDLTLTNILVNSIPKLYGTTVQFGTLMFSSCCYFKAVTWRLVNILSRASPRRCVNSRWSTQAVRTMEITKTDGIFAFIDSLLNDKLNSWFLKHDCLIFPVIQFTDQHLFWFYKNIAYLIATNLISTSTGCRYSFFSILLLLLVAFDYCPQRMDY